MTAEMSHDPAASTVAGPALRVKLLPTVSAAFWHNAIPVLHEIEIANSSPDSFETAEIVLTADPPFAAPRSWHVQGFLPGQTRRLSELDITLDGAFLDGLTESVRARALFSLRSGDTTLATTEEAIRLLPPNEWGGSNTIPDILAAFVEPNDPAVARIIHTASDLLRRSGKTDSLEGYQSGRKQRVWEQAAALWSAVASLDIRYVNPPPSFEKEGQKIRPPRQIYDERLATCLDLAALFAACLEFVGLHPLIVLTRGHAFAGLWLAQEDFASSVIDDPQSLRKRIKLDEIVLFETTLATHQPAPGFQRASTVGAEHLAEEKDAAFELAIDIHRARMRRIRPLSARLPHAQVAIANNGVIPSGPPRIDEPPQLREVEDFAPPAQQGPLGRVERWKRKLLDLSTRNRLLNFRPGRHALMIDCPDPARLEDLLAENKEFKVLPRPPIMTGADPRSARIHQDRAQEDAARAYAREAMDRGELFVGTEKEALDASLVEIFRTARSAMQEGGANTLFLTIGFLSWKRQDRDTPYRAPLVLVPVELKRSSVRSGFRLARLDDEARLNATLLEMLRQDYAVDMPTFDRGAPTDESGLNIPAILDEFRKKVRDIPGWEITEDVALATFSFTKYLMWKDLAERTDKLRVNEVARRLIDGNRSDAPSDDWQDVPDTRELDERLGAGELLCPTEADSSQLRAVAAAAAGKSYVLIGPPGTGKSQTITNIIANALGQDKTVLFVSEKMAALDVVHRRLTSIGLGEFCLELHSSKANKLAVLQQLGRAQAARRAFAEDEWTEAVQHVDALRRELNALVRALHHRHPNGWTVHRAIGLVVRSKDDIPEIRLSWPGIHSHDVAGFKRLIDVVERMAATAAQVGSIANHALANIAQHDWSATWQSALLTSAKNALPKLGAVVETVDAAAKVIGFAPPRDLAGLRALKESADLLLADDAADGVWALSGDFPKLAVRLESGCALISKHRELKARLSRPYAPAVVTLPLSALLADWRAAKDKWFGARFLTQRRVRSALAEHAGGKAPADCEADLQFLVEMQALEKEIAAAADLQGATGGLWMGLETDTARLTTATEWGRRMRTSTAALAPDPAALLALREAVRRLVQDGAELLAEGGALGRPLKSFADAMRAAEAGVREAMQLAHAAEDGPTCPPAEAWTSHLTALLTRWIENAPRIRDWCAWRAVCREADELGLAPMADAMRAGIIPSGRALEALRANYARWWADLAVDAEPALRGFVSAQHELKIETFRRLDERVQKLAAQLVQARLAKAIPGKKARDTDPEYAVLNRELAKQRRHLPVRQLISRMPRAMTRLAPCFLMSPLSIAQYLPADSTLFDLVIFDEASQIPTWDAIGALGRARQVIVVGDPKQLPPTRFFERAEQDDADGEVEVEDLESVLDECIGAGVPQITLNWHYRSRHESLIAFSNHTYYKDLVTFPSPVTQDTAVSFHHVPTGVYARAGARTNQVEAKAVVADVVRLLRAQADALTPLSVGIVTFNAEQQRLIEDLLDEERRRNAALERFFGNTDEPLFVKNLENVQGDERDVIYFSLTYGPDATGRMAMNFGPLNQSGGERRLNVAVTRARHAMRVFGTLRAENIDLNRTNATGVAHLKRFLEFAERGPRALFEAAAAPGGEHESPFEAAVAAALAAKGWTTHPQVGVSGFRVDLGVVHPDAPGRYLVGVECDGATYHASATACDRDRLRQHQLNRLGWQIVRIWSTDWWVNAADALDRVHRRLEELLAADRASSVAVSPENPDSLHGGGGAAEQNAGSDARGGPAANDGTAVDPTDMARPRDKAADEQAERMADQGSPASERSRPVYARGTPLPQRIETTYRPADPTTVAKLEPQRFYDAEYRATLRSIIGHIIGEEGPILDRLLIDRVARAHGFERSGRRIAEMVLENIPADCPRTADGDSHVLWPRGAVPEAGVPFRGAGGRGIDLIPMDELVSLARLVIEENGSDHDRARTMARRLDLKRLHEASRPRLEEALKKARLLTDRPPEPPV